MRKILILLALFIGTNCAFCEDGFDFDMKFLDNPFAGQKMVSDKEFNEAVQKMTPKKKEPSKFSKWFWGAKDGPNKGQIDPQMQRQFDQMPSEMGSTKEAINAKPVLTIGTQIVDSEGKNLPSGHYQVDLKNINGQNYIVFMQAYQTLGKFKATPCKDDWNQNLIIYSRLINTENGYYKIIFSNLDGTHQGFARIIE